MSLKTWIQEFYPISAQRTDIKDAAQHSLNKWQGLLPENLAKHDMIFAGGAVEDDVAGEYFEIDASSCALCHHYMDHSARYGDMCNKCPLSIARGGVQCDQELFDEAEDPYHAFIKHRNPYPMMCWLRKTIEMQQK